MKKAKERKEQGLFVVEGVKMFGEAPREWLAGLTNKKRRGDVFYPFFVLFIINNV